MLCPWTLEAPGRAWLIVDGQGVTADLGVEPSPLPPIPCYILWKEVYITAAGDVRPCCEFYEDRYSLGNIFRQPFAHIWNGARAQRMRARSARLELPAPVCESCNRFYVNYLAHEKLTRARGLLGPLGHVIRTDFEAAEASNGLSCRQT